MNLNSGRYRQAETSLANAIALEPNFATYYWLAKCFSGPAKRGRGFGVVSTGI